MVNDDTLSDLLSEFARTLITDFPIERILDHLVGRIVDVMPVDSAGVTLISSGVVPRYIAASNESAMRYERLQSDIVEGPCLLAYKTGEAVAVPNLDGDERFPEFGPSGVQAGLAAVFTFPLRHGDERLGALDLYRDSPGALDTDDMTTAQTLADVAAAYLLNAMARTRRRPASERLTHEMFHDALTGLPNRLLSTRTTRTRRTPRSPYALRTAVLFADIDQFKEVNDTFGHHAGDALLVAFVGRLSALVRAGDTLARFSGDEFVLLCEDIRDDADAVQLAERISDSLAQPFEFDGNRITVTASVGIAYAGPGDDLTGQLLIDADQAMYRAKRRRYSKSRGRDIGRGDVADFVLENDLRAALDAEQLTVVYQPIVAVPSGRIEAVEALLRWNHPTRGPIEPRMVVRIAERSNLINEVGAWVLEHACRDHARWTQHDPTLALSVNLSARQLATAGLAKAIRTLLTTTSMDPTKLVLEITETMLVDDSNASTSTLTDLDALGIRLALDDFGAGYSSLSYLDRLPIRIIKIDQQFVSRSGSIGRQHDRGSRDRRHRSPTRSRRRCRRRRDARCNTTRSLPSAATALRVSTTRTPWTRINWMRT